MGQLAQAHRDRLETGKQVLDIIVERGWVSADEVSALRAAHGIEPPPAPLVEVVPESSPELGAPPSAAASRYTIAIRLTSGDLITAGETEGSDKAAALGQAVVADVTSDDDEWPFFGGRYINPETIISVDLLPEDPDG
jgi:hypothetical protein